MENKKIIFALDATILEVETYMKQYSLEKTSDFIDILKVLNLLKQELIGNNINSINNRILRAFKDICTLISIQYEHTQFNDSVFLIYNLLSELNVKFSKLELLGADFGKSNPI